MREPTRQRATRLPLGFIAQKYQDYLHVRKNEERTTESLHPEKNCALTVDAQKRLGIEAEPLGPLEHWRIEIGRAHV